MCCHLSLDTVGLKQASPVQEGSFTVPQCFSGIVTAVVLSWPAVEFGAVPGAPQHPGFAVEATPDDSGASLKRDTGNTDTECTNTRGISNLYITQ